MAYKVSVGAHFEPALYEYYNNTIKVNSVNKVNKVKTMLCSLVKKFKKTKKLEEPK